TRATRQFLHRDAGRDRVEPGATCAFAQADAEQAEFGHAFVERTVEAVVAIDRRCARPNLGLREPPRRVPQRLLVLGVETVHGVSLPSVAGELGIVGDLVLLAVEEVCGDIGSRYPIGGADAPRQCNRGGAALGLATAERMHLEQDTLAGTW